MANISFKQNILPKTDNTYTLGNSSYKWQAYLSSINDTAIANLLLPAVSASDNGKILKVSNGAWTVAANTMDTSNLGFGTLAQIEAALVTLGASMSNYEIKNIRFGFNDSESVFLDYAYLGTIARGAADRYVVKVQPIANKGEIITGNYRNSAWSWTAYASNATFVGSGSSASAGLVPSPGSTAGTSKYLREDGTWQIPPDNNTTYSVFVGSGSNATTGLVPAPSTTAGTSKFLCEDGTWAVPPDTNTTYSTMTGASSSAAGTSGLAPAPAAGDEDKFLAGDGTYKSGGKPMVVLSYGSSTWNDFINAYNNNIIVYCKASSNANPASGAQTRMAFMAYVNANPPTNVEFQYYRSMNPNNKSVSQMSDQVFVYTLNSSGTWSVTSREASIKEIKAATNSKIGVSYSSNVVTLSNTMTADDMPMSSSDATTTKAAIDALDSKIDDVLPDVTLADNGKFLCVVNGEWAAVTMQEWQGGSY